MRIINLNICIFSLHFKKKLLQFWFSTWSNFIIDSLRITVVTHLSLFFFRINENLTFFSLIIMVPIQMRNSQKFIKFLSFFPTKRWKEFKFVVLNAFEIGKIGESWKKSKRKSIFHKQSDHKDKVTIRKAAEIQWNIIRKHTEAKAHRKARIYWKKTETNHYHYRASPSAMHTHSQHKTKLFHFSKNNKLHPIKI